MSWYSAGSVTVANGSNVVTGAGTDFVANASIGEAFIGPDGRSYEIAQIVSATDLRLAKAYQAATGGGQSYSIQPTQSLARDLARGVAELIGGFASVRDGVGQGLFADGSAAAPGMRFTADQDTGVARLGDNILALVAGGVARLTADLNGATIRGAYCNAIADEFPQYIVSRSGVGSWRMGGLAAGSNSWALQFNATPLMAMDSQGNLGVGITAPTSRLDAALPGAGTPRVRLISYGDEPAIDFSRYTGAAGLYYGGRIGMNLDALCFYNSGGAAVGAGAWNERMRLDSAGNLLVGVTSSAAHRIEKSGLSEGGVILGIAAGAGSAITAEFRRVDASPFNGGAPAALMLGHNTTNNRSATTSGTLNASGADYAEYMTKADGCGPIAAGDVCGVDGDGLLTDKWATALTFVVKSTDPSMVGNDTWAAHLGPRPEAPGAEPIAPAVPGAKPAAPVEPGPEPTEEGAAYVAWLQDRFAYAVALHEYDAALAAWQAATDAYPAARTAFEAGHAAWVAATAAYERDLPIYEAAVEAARQKVDRIAFCGQVPVNMTGPVQPGDYLVASQDGERIKVVAVHEADMTLPLMLKRVGKVLAIRDDRPWVNVQHG